MLDDADRRRAWQARRRLPRPGAAGQPPVRGGGDDGRGGRPRSAARRAHRRHRAGRRRTSRASPGTRCATPNRWRRPTRRGRSRPRSGSTPPARPAPPRARCTGTSTSATSARPTRTQVLGVGRDDVCLSARSCSSPTARQQPAVPAVGGRERGAGAVAAQPRALRASGSSSTASPCSSAARASGARCIAARPSPRDVRDRAQRRLGGRGPARARCTRRSRSGTASRSSTASAPPRRCTSSSPTSRARSCPAARASRCPATRSSCAAPTAP